MTIDSSINDDSEEDLNMSLEFHDPSEPLLQSNNFNENDTSVLNQSLSNIHTVSNKNNNQKSTKFDYDPDWSDEFSFTNNKISTANECSTKDSNNIVINDNDDSFKQDNFDLSQVTDRMYHLNKTPYFTNSELASLRLFQILNKANAPLSLYKDLQEYINSIIPLLQSFNTSSSSPFIINRSALITQMHPLIFNGSQERNHTTRRNKRKESKISSSTTTTTNTNINTIKNDSSHHVKDLVANKNKKRTFTLMPKLSPLRLSEPGEEGVDPIQINIPTFDFVSSVLSLLNDPILTCPKNLLYLQHSSYLQPSNIDNCNEEDMYLDDIHTSDWFRHTHKRMITNSSEEILCPLIFFIDGVAVDTYGRKSLEPVSFTLGFFNRQTRNQSSAWRILGYIPNVEKSTYIDYKSMKNGQDHKKNHYHKMLSMIFAQVRDVQTAIQPIQISLPFPTNDNSGNTRSFKVKFPIMYIIGDCVGNDKLCSRNQNYVPNKLLNNGVCRDCNVWYELADSHTFKCNPISRSMIKSIQKKKKLLKRLGFHDLVENAFDKLCFGAYSNGINGSTPPETLHQWYLGIVCFVIDYFLERLTTKAKAELDEMVKVCANNFSRQSDRSFPTVSPFKVGIDKVKLTGEERESQLFAIFLAMLSSDNKLKLVETEKKAQHKFRIEKLTLPDGRKITRRTKLKKLIGDNESYNRWLDMFESMLSISEWLCHPDKGIAKQDVIPSVKVKMKEVEGYEEWMYNLWETNKRQYCRSQQHKLSTSVSSPENLHMNDENRKEDNRNSTGEDVEVVEDGVELLGEEDGVCEETIPNTTDKETEHSNDAEHLIQEVNEEDLMPNDDEEEDIIEEGKYESVLNEVERSNFDENTSITMEELPKEYNDPLYYSNGKFFQMKTTEKKISKAEYGFRVFIQKLKACICPADRHRLKTVKLHQLIHYPLYILKYGSPLNFCSAVSESHGKDTAKRVGKHTQQRNESINIQAARRFLENIIIQQVIHLVCAKQGSKKQHKLVIALKNASGSLIGDVDDGSSRGTTDECSQTNKNSLSHTTNKTFAVYGKAEFIFSYNSSYRKDDKNSFRRINNISVFDSSSENMKEHNSNNFSNESLRKESTTYTSDVSHKNDDHIRTKIVQKCADTMMTLGMMSCYEKEMKDFQTSFSIQLFNRVKWKGENFRCATSYHGQENSWFDWVNIDWGHDFGVLPAKLMAIFDGESIIRQLINKFVTSKEYRTIDECISKQNELRESFPSSKMWCLVHSASSTIANKATFVSKLSTLRTMESSLQIVGLESIDGGAFVLENTNWLQINTNEKKGLWKERLLQTTCSYDIIVLHNREEWAHKFMDVVSKTKSFRPIVTE